MESARFVQGAKTAKPKGAAFTAKNFYVPSIVIHYVICVKLVYMMKINYSYTFKFLFEKILICLFLSERLP